jgi:hypothetical protein
MEANSTASEKTAKKKQTTKIEAKVTKHIIHSMTSNIDVKFSYKKKVAFNSGLHVSDNLNGAALNDKSIGCARWGKTTDILVSQTIQTFVCSMAQPNPKTDPPREGVSTLVNRSCNDCNRRKVRCNKRSPCDNCLRLGFECTFPPPGRKARTKTKTSNKSELISRLSLLEREVQRLGAKNAPGVAANTDANLTAEESLQSSLTSAASLPKTPTSLESNSESKRARIHVKSTPPSVTIDTSENALDYQFGRLVVDRNNGTSRYVNHRVLTDLGDQVNFLFRFFIKFGVRRKFC